MSKNKYATPETAKLVGVSRQTLQMWCKGGFINAPRPVEIGHVSVRLWTRVDIQWAKRFKGTLRPGPKEAK